MTLRPGDHLWYWTTTCRVSFDPGIPWAEWFPGATGPVDLRGEGPQIFNYVVHESGIVRGRPHLRNHPGTYTWLNHNPGNLTGRPGGPDLGQYPDRFNGEHFLVFPDRETGFAAIARLLRGPAYAGLTLTAALRAYPSGIAHHDPGRYVAQVAAAAGVDASATVGDLDDDQMLAVQHRIAGIEGAVAGETLAPDSPDLPAEVAVLLP
ncbi:hypothetical protein BJY16_003010 [Actinoplanes octamycinicus]|uniref:Uncharacterized protein n=1 Tax=Actinoplanes octamycinicus TaxID=135948 RepID=A0A7W7GWG5_9ACTN|nr:hypothetical protein [Actinoplanes octamycinicus]MBB4739551.1 hypothetical protein [Actinoplanes octamycinicus]GIE54732.1 hypothetical protein Aoc01nite_01340 [Actinoplanes octamycinicus]